MKGSIIVIDYAPKDSQPSDVFLERIKKAHNLSIETPARVIWFCDDSVTEFDARFEVENEIQAKFSPLYAKKLTKKWQTENAYRNIRSDTVAGFCIRMYQKLLDGVEIIRSSDPSVRRAAIEVPDFFVDTEYQRDVVRAKFENGVLKLTDNHQVATLPLPPFDKEKISPGPVGKLLWLKSVLPYTHLL